MKLCLDSVVESYLRSSGEKMLMDRYAVHGTIIDLATNSTMILRDIRADYSYFRTAMSEVKPDNRLYAFVLGTKKKSLISVSDGAVLFSRSLGFDIYRFEELYFVKSKVSDAAGVLDDEGNLFVGIGTESSAFSELLHNIFEACLISRLERKGIHRLHASAVAKDKSFGILFPASMLGGKTTTFLCCIKAGLKYLTDDICLIQRNDSKLNALAFPTRVGVDQDFIQRFPDLRFLLEGEPFTYSTGIKKWFLNVKEAFTNSILEECEPRLLIFPRLWWSEKSKIEKISKGDAMQELIRIFLEPSFLKFGSSISSIRTEKFELSSLLVDSTGCYRLHIGRKPELLTKTLVEFF